LYRVGRAGLVRKEGHVADHEGVRRAATHGTRVVQHISIVTGTVPGRPQTHMPSESPTSSMSMPAASAHAAVGASYA